MFAVEFAAGIYVGVARAISLERFLQHTAVTFALAGASRRHPNLFPKPPAEVSGN